MSDSTRVKRALIRHYLVNKLKRAVDVGGRVFANRPTSPAFLEEIPAVFVSCVDETTEMISGSQYLVKEYQRNAAIIFTIVVEEVLDPKALINENPRGDDYLDFLGAQVEQAIFADLRLARDLDGFDPNSRMEGLTYGARLEGTKSYDVEADGERRLIAQDIRFTFPYQTPGYSDKRFPMFEEYYAAIVRVGRAESTVDPVLLAMEGEINDS